MSLFFNVSPAFFAQVVLAYLVSYSLRFDGSGDYLSWSDPPASNRTTNTFAFWFKPMENAVNNAIFFQQRKATLGTKDLQFIIQMRVVSGRNSLRILGQENDINNILLDGGTDLDFEAGTWYHLVVAVDTTQGVSSDRVKVWIDGQLYTGWATATYPSQNYNTGINRASTRMLIGVQRPNSSATLNTYSNIQLAEYHFIDGTAYDETYFGETRDGVWVPKEVTDIDYGNNGFYLDFKGNDSGVTLLLDGSSATTDSSSANIASNLIAASGVTATDTTALGISRPYGSSAVDVLDFSNTQTGGISHTSGPILPLLDPEDTQWTLEMWVRPESFPGVNSYDYLIAQAKDGANSWSNGLEWILDWDTTNIYFVGHNGNSNTSLLQANLSTYGITVNNWHHIAVVRDGSDTMLFLNGTKAATVTNQNAVKISDDRHLFIGTDPTAAYNFDGQMTDIRITKGVARYTDSFTPPTSALSADVSGITGSNDAVLKLNADNSLTDETGRHTPTAGSTTSYSTDVPFSSGNSHSFSFSGNQTDVITLPNSTDFEFGSDDFTVEMWVKWDGTTGVKVLFNTYNGSSWSGLAIGMSNGVLGVWVDTTGTSPWEIDNASGGLSFTANKWHHLAVVRRGYTFDAFLDGVKGTTLGTISGSIYAEGTHDAHIGGGTALYAFNGLIDDVRITKAALYPFHPPISALTNTPEYLGDFGVDRTTDGTGVTLLLDGTSATDDLSSVNQDANNYITNNGSITTTSLAGPSGYGTVSALDLNGSSQYLTTTYYTSSLYNQDFTIEGWFYIDDTVGSRSFFSHRSSGSAYDSVIPYISTSSTYGLVVGDGANPWEILTTGGSVTTGWHHIAVTRNGNDYVLWVDGTSTLTGTYSGTVSASGNFAIGAGSSTTPSQYIHGKVFDFRVTEGVARYSDTFTPPTSALSADVSGITGSDDVTLLLNGVTATDQSNANTGLTNNGVLVNQNSQSHPYATGTLLFDTNNADYLTISTENDNLYLGTDDWTIEGWFRTTDLGLPNVILEYRASGPTNGAGRIMLVVRSTGDIGIYEDSVYQAQTATGTIVINTWYHIAFTRKGGDVYIFVNGSLAASGSLSSSTVDILRPSGRPLIGGYDGGGANWIGEWVDFRITKGAALYPFHPPISALTNDDTWDKPKNDFLVEGNITPDDQLLDTPNLRFASFDPSNKGANITLSEANFNSVSSSGYSSVITTETIPTGSKIYVEWTCDNSGALNFIGIAPSLPTGYVGDASTGWGLYMPLASGNLEIWNNGQLATTLTASTGPAAPHVAMMAVDRVNNAIHFGYNGLWRTTTTATTTLPSTAPVTGIDSNSTYYIVASPSPSRSVITNLGQDHTFAGAKPALLTPYSDANGVGEFYYQPPSGFLALATEYK